jgi:hypothetical protein
MSSTQPPISSGGASERKPLLPSIRVYSEPTGAGLSSIDFAFQGENVATSTLFEVSSIEETRGQILWFAQGGGVDPSDLNAIVFLHDSFAQKSVQTVNGALTANPIQSTDRALTGLRSFRDWLILKPTSLQNAVFKRVSELMELAVEDNIEMSPSSFWDLWSFISARAGAQIPNVFALDNGNFRAVWKNSVGERIALEFQGSQIVEFVIFECDRSLGRMLRMAGTQVLSRIPDLITAVHLARLLEK